MGCFHALKAIGKRSEYAHKSFNMYGLQNVFQKESMTLQLHLYFLSFSPTKKQERFNGHGGSLICLRHSPNIVVRNKIGATVQHAGSCSKQELEEEY